MEKRRGYGFSSKKSPKRTVDLNLFSLDFESVRISLSTPQKQKLFSNVNYSSNKKLTFSFLEQLAINIDNVITVNKKLFLVGDINITIYMIIKKKAKNNSFSIRSKRSKQNSTNQRY